jgi:hypothetical protein
VCHHKKSGEFGLFVGTLLSLGEWLSLFLILLYIFKMREVIGHVCFSDPLCSLAFALFTWWTLESILC